MKRIKIVGLCLIAVVALSAVASSGASAAEFFTCVKAVPRNSGHYSDKECSVKVASGGKYERASAVGVRTSGKTKTVVIAVPALGFKLTCKKSTSAGEITGPSEGEEVITFSDCSTEGKPCQNIGGASGVFKTNPLRTTLVSATEVELAALVGGREGLFVEFECGGVVLRWTGFTVEHITDPESGHASTKATAEFSGEDNLETEISVAPGVDFPTEINATAAYKNSPALGRTK